MSEQSTVDRLRETRDKLEATNLSDDGSRILRHYVKTCFDFIEESLFQMVARIEQMEATAIEKLEAHITEQMDKIEKVLTAKPSDDEGKSNNESADEIPDGPAEPTEGYPETTERV